MTVLELEPRISRRHVHRAPPGPQAITIPIHQEHIDGAVAGSPKCPLARAAATAGHRHVRIYLLTLEADGCRYAVPPAVKTWIARFDRGLAVQPAAFTFPPDPRPSESPAA